MSRQISLNTRLQGNDPFLEIQTLNEDHFTFNANSQLGLADNLSLSGNLNMGGNLTINGALSLGTGADIASDIVTANNKVVTDKIEFSDNQTEGLIIESSDGADYIVCKSTDGAEQIQLKKSTFTDGNSMIMGTNGSRGILQYANIKNSTIDNTNTITANASTASALQTTRLIGGISFNGTANIDLPGVNTAGNQNTTGTSASWATARTTTFSGEDDETLGNVSIQGTGDTSATLAVAHHDQTNSSAHKLMLTNAITGHNSNGLQEQIRFKNEFMSGMNQSDNLVANWVQQKDITTFRIYDITASNTFQETSFARDSTGSHPKMNGFLEWNTDTSTGGFLSLSRDSSSYDSGSNRELPTGIKLLNLGEYNGSNLGGEMGGIKSNFVSEEFANTKVYAKYVSGSVGEASLTIKKDIFVMANSSALEFGSSDRRIVYNNAECAFTGSDDLFTFDYKMNVGKGKDDGNPATFGIEHINNIALGGADQEILSLKYTEGNTPTTHNYSFNGKSGGGISFSRQQYATSQDAYSGTKTVTDILTMNSTQTTLYKPLNLSDSALNIRPEGDQFNLSLGHYNNANNFWSHSVNSDIDYIIQSSGGRNFQIVTPSTGALTTNSGSFTLSTTNDHFYVNTPAGYHPKINPADPRYPIQKLNGTIAHTGNNDYNYFFNARRTDGATGFVGFVNGTSRTQDGGASTATLRNDTGRLRLGNSTYDTHIYGATVFMGDNSTGGADKIYFAKRASNFGDLELFGTSGPTASKASIFMSFNLHIDSPSTIGHIYLNNYSSTKNTYVRNYVALSSDERIKKDIELVDDDEALNKILALETKKFNYIDVETTHKQIGFIAQDVEKIIPDAVSKTEGHGAELMLECDFSYKHCCPDEENRKEYHILTINTDILEDGVKYRVKHNGQEKDLVASVIDGVTTMKLEGDLEWGDILKILIVGKCVSDFLRVKHGMIYNLHHSGIQQLHRLIKKQEQEHDEYVVEAETKIANLEKMIIDLTKRVALNENALKTLL